MSNVLPPEERKNLMKRVHARFVFVGAAVLLAGAIVAMLALLPAFISVRLAQASIGSDQAEGMGAVREDQEKATRAQAVIDALKPYTSASSTPSEILIDAVAGKPAGMRITSITYSKGQVVLSGASASREAINEFREILQKNTNFTKVTVPVAALVGAQEGRFSVTLNGEF